LKGLSPCCGSKVSSFVFQENSLPNYMNPNSKHNKNLKQSFFFHVFMCVILSLLIVMGADLVAHNNVGQYDKFVILDKSFWTCQTWLMVFCINQMVDLLT
jgi:hypothetical protein